ncbi:hypothetical protein KO495_14785 [Colwellia sp. D2M02]|nr:hypothetical protein [Colwellia sp. D2M02]
MELSSELTTFLGWCSVINIGILLFTTLAMTLFKSCISEIHSQLTGVEKVKLLPLYFHYMGQYKIFILVFNLVPYCALKLMTS